MAPSGVPEAATGDLGLVVLPGLLLTGCLEQNIHNWYLETPR